VTAETVGRTDPHGAGQMRARNRPTASWLATIVDSIASALSGDALPGLGSRGNQSAAIKQFCGKMPFQPVDNARSLWHDRPPAAGRPRIPFRRAQWRAQNGSHPIDRTAALIQHFRTSMVQYLGLVSQEMQVKKALKRSIRD